jgi:glucose/arabinose dehydrogenase
LADAPFAVTSQPERFRVTTFASGLSYSTGLQALSDGSLLVATSEPVGGYFNSVGTLLRLADANHDGMADGPGSVLFTGLPGAVSAVELVGNLAFVMSSQSGQERISILRQGASPGDAYSYVGAVHFSFPANAMHTSYGLTSRPIAGGHEVYFNIGSRMNAANDAMTVGVSGMVSGSLNPESIYRFTVQNDGTTVTLGGLQQIASGLRNAAGLAFHPGSGDLYFSENGIDGPVDPNEPVSADELNRITAGTIGSSVPDFGFAGTYTNYRTGALVGSSGASPAAVFQPEAITGSEREGANQIAFAPAAFPDGLNNGIFIGFHGRFLSAGLANEENPLVYYDLATGEMIDFLSNDLPFIGHPDGLLTTADSLFISDINAGGSMFSASPDGRIYQVQVIHAPEAGTLGFVVLGVAGLFRRRR